MSSGILLPHMESHSGFFDESYTSKIYRVCGSNLIGHWSMDDAVGAIMHEGRLSRDGIHTGVTLGAAGIGDGRTASRYIVADSSRSFSTNAALLSAINYSELTLSARIKFGSGSLTDGTLRYCFRLGVNGNNDIALAKSATNNQFRMFYIAGGTNKERDVASLAEGVWYHFALAISKSNDRVIGYFNGVKQGATLTGLGVFVGSVAEVVMGNQNSAGAVPMNGDIAHVILCNAELNGDQIAELARIAQ